MSNIVDAKAAARKAAFAARKLAHESVDAAAASENLSSFLREYRGRPTSGYMAIRTEISPLTVMAEIAKFGAVAVPVILGRGQPLEFHRWDTKTPMISGPFGAMVPIDPKVIVPDVLIVPMVAFDRRGRRLGYGGGYYDRTLEILRATRRVVAVGFAYSGQQVDELPCEPTDQVMDAVVTETGILRFGS